MHGLADVVLWAVDQYWKHHKINYSDFDGKIEKLLSLLVQNADEPCAKLWAAIIIHALQSEHDMLKDLRDAMLAETTNALQQPANSLLKTLGFVVEDGIVHSLNFESQIISVVSDQAVLQRSLQLDFLNHQSRGEICLALSGAKVSRLHMTIKEVCTLSEILECQILISAHRYESIIDVALGEFSNLAVKGDRVTHLEDSAQVYAYFGNTPVDRLLVSVLDENNAAGAYLGIPACCRMSFNDVWRDACQDHAGDVAFKLISDQSARTGAASIFIPWQCNPYGMYQGGGVLWHFPCSFDCQLSIELVNSRIEALRQIDSTFADESHSFQTRHFWLGEDRQISFVEPKGRAIKVLPII